MDGREGGWVGGGGGWAAGGGLNPLLRQFGLAMSPSTFTVPLPGLANWSGFLELVLPTL